MNYIFTNGNILDINSQAWVNNSVLTSEGKITCLGSYDECRQAAKKAYETIDLKGRLLIPAFTDAHTHFVEYAKSRILVNLNACRSLSEMQSYLTDYRNKLSWEPSWILGVGWNRNLLSQPKELNRFILDAVFPHKPVALMSKDYHSKWCNSLALQLAGIDSKTPDPAGGRIERDHNGLPTGVLYETAAEMIDRYVESASDQQVVKAIRSAIREIHTLGLSGFHTMESKASRDLLLAARQPDAPFRMVWHFPLAELDLAAQEGFVSYEGEGFYQIGGMKLFGDGSLGSQTAAMFEAYPADKQNFGILRYSDAELLELMVSAAEKGFSSTIHAIGNRSVRQVIDAATKLMERGAYPKLLHRIEHVQAIRPQDIPLLKRSGLIASVQPLHLAYDIHLIEAHWQALTNQVYSFATILKEGVPMCFGSDAPIESLNPFLGIYSALQRREELKPDLPVFRKSEMLSVPQAVHGYTLGAAFAAKAAASRGSIELGKQADLGVIQDFRNLPSSFWLTAGSQLTMIAGEIVYSQF